MAELTQEGLERALTDHAREMNRMLSSRPSSTGGGLTSSSMSMLDGMGNKVAGAANSMIDVFGQISSGTATTADALKAADFVLKQFGGTVGSVAGNAISTLGGEVLKVNETMKITAEFGVTLSGSLGDFNQAVKHGHLTMEEFADIISKSSQQIVGLAGGMDQSARAFTTVLADIVESDVARDLKAAGMSSKELAEIFQISAMNRRGLDITEKKSREEAAAAALYLATEIDIAAQVTGKSRKQEEEELKKEQQRADVQAMIALKGPEFAKNLEQATVGLSESAKRVVGIYATGGPRSKEDVELVASYGQATEKLADLARSIESNDQAAIERSKVEAQAAVADRMQDRSYLTGVVATEGKLFGGSAAKVLQDEMALERSIAAKQKEMGEGTTREQAIEAMREAAKSRIKGELPTGEMDPNAAASRAINSFDNFSKVLAATASDGFKKLNDELGKSVKDTLPEFNRMLKEMASPAGVERKFQESLEAGKEFVNEATEIPVPKKRKTGSYGMTGKFLEDFGAGELVELHGKESVVTQEQMLQLTKDIYSDKNAFESSFLPGELSTSIKKSMSTYGRPGTTLESLGVTGFGNNMSSAGDISDIFSKSVNQFGSELKRIADVGINATNDLLKFSTNAISNIGSSSNVAKTDLNTTLKSLGVTGFGSQSTAPTGKPKEPDFFKSVSDVFFGIGNAASKSYDKIFTDKVKTTSNKSISGYAAGDDVAALKDRYKTVTGDTVAAEAQKFFKGKTVDPLANMSGLGGTIKTWQSSMTNDLKAQKEEELRKEKAAQESQATSAEPAKTEQSKAETTETVSQSASMSDLKDELIKLNIGIRELISHTDRVAEGVGKQIKATKSMSGNRLT